MIEAGFLLVGWLLGLLSPELVERIRRRYRRREFSRTLAIELDELRYRQVINVLDIRLSSSSLDRDLLNWAKPVVDNYTGALAETPASRGMARLADCRDEEIVGLNAVPPDTRKTTTFVKYTTPYLNARLDLLPLLKLDTQRRLLELRTRLDVYHVSIDQINKYHDRTFDAGLSDVDRVAVQENIKLWTVAVESAARHVVRQVNAIIPALERRNLATP